MLKYVITSYQFLVQSLRPAHIPLASALPILRPIRTMLIPMFLGIVAWSGMGFLPPYAWSLSGKPAVITSPIELQPLLAHSFARPVFLTPSPDTTNRLFIVEQEGRIFIVQRGQLNPTPFLDISQKVTSEGEQGLLGLAFHPQFSTNGRLFINYSREPDGATVIAEYKVGSSPNAADPRETILLIIPQPYTNHNGGMLAFGPDNLLYIGMGDGGAGGDPENRAQNLEELLGKMLRIDVNGPPPYRIPNDNPFVTRPGRDEIFALGLRNPWRFSFDRVTGTLWAGDVGQDSWEEIDVIQKGKNYGWRFLEGSQCFNPETNCKLVPNLVPPVTEYGQEKDRCSVTGGYVYRGSQIPELVGTYVFGDFCTGEIWGYRDGETRLLLDSNLLISSFGEDLTGELYVIGHRGEIVKMATKKVVLTSSIIQGVSWLNNFKLVLGIRNLLLWKEGELLSERERSREANSFKK